jgi:ATP-dependent DNA helicase RecG
LEACPLEYPDDFRVSDIARFARQIRVARDSSENVSDEHIAESMRLGKIRDGRLIPNNVCALLFAKDPQRVFPGAYVHFLRYSGTEEKSGKEYNVIKDRMISGSILEVIRDTTTTLDANLREFTEFRSGKFYTLPEYPRDAWYELIVNACVHRFLSREDSTDFCKDARRSFGRR